MAYSHKFRIKAGEFDCKGKISSTEGGMGYYQYDDDSPRPNGELDTLLSEIIEKVGQFLKAQGSLEKFIVEPIE